MADERISSQDSGYVPGDLSIFPNAIDDAHILFQATNNAKVKLKQTLTYNGKVIIVDPDTEDFPDSGVIRIGGDPRNDGAFELIAYNKRTRNTFQEIRRGFAGTNQNVWRPGKDVYVTNSVIADHHNALKDAVINVQKNLGLKSQPDPNSLNGILNQQEVRFLSPKPLFRAYPLRGAPSLAVRFQNFTTGHVIRWLWDFGDGTTSLERSPIHTYLSEGRYTVKLNVITSTGGQGVVTKKNYITVDRDESEPFFYVESTTQPYSIKTAQERTLAGNPTVAKEFTFIDQTDGDIVQRNWILSDNFQYTEEDPDVHTIKHVFADPGEYVVTLIIIFANGRLKKVELTEPLIVL